MVLDRSRDMVVVVVVVVVVEERMRVEVGVKVEECILPLVKVVRQPSCALSDSGYRTCPDDGCLEYARSVPDQHFCGQYAPL